MNYQDLSRKQQVFLHTLITRAVTTHYHQQVVLRYIKTPEGGKLLRQAVKLAASKAADELDPNGPGFFFARALAGLPPKGPYAELLKGSR